MRLGVHISIAGGLLKAIERARKLECTTMQIFSRSPRGGPAPTFPDDDIVAFQAQRAEAGIFPLAVHCPYIINLASSTPQVWAQSAALYRDEYHRCQRIGAQYLVTHVGSHRGGGERIGMQRVAEALNCAVAQAPASVMMLLENTAGSGQGLGYTFEQLLAIRNQVTNKQAVGICLDTAHLFASGFPIHTADGLDEVLHRFDAVIGFEHLKLIHLNDSKSGFNSRVDRHWHIGQGQIGLEAMCRIVNHPQLSNVPMILETPKKQEDDDPRNLAIVRSLRASKAHGAVSALRP